MDDELPTVVLYEHAVGYVLFTLHEFDDVTRAVPQVEESMADVSRFASLVSPLALCPFRDTEAALANCNALSEGVAHEDLVNFLRTHLPAKSSGKKSAKHTRLGVADARLTAAIAEALPHVRCTHSGVVPSVLRGIRQHVAKLVGELAEHDLGKAQLGLGHGYSRAKVKFDVHRADNMIIQAIALLDQLDKDINTFGMRLREWYSYHFPELYRLVPEQSVYCKCVKAVRDRKNMADNIADELTEITQNEETSAAIIEAARTSMGMDISAIDLINVERFTERVISLVEYRGGLQEYLKQAMHNCAPSLSALIGDQVGARLISHAGSLTNLSKYPASTIQILGAEKALFRALKTRGKTPKYGLLFHSTFIGRASAKNKGRISRFLANKCAVASRIDNFSETPVETFGVHMRQQVEARLKYFETGECPKKNVEVMQEAAGEAVGAKEKARKKAKKRAKKEAKAKQALLGAESMDDSQEVDKVEPADESEPASPKKSKKRKASGGVDKDEPAEEQAAEAQEPGSAKKKKKRKSAAAEVE